MLEIKENQKLNIMNVFSYRGKVRQIEIENIGKEMEVYIQNAGVKRAGNPITATYAIEGDVLFVVLWHVWQQEDGQQLLRVLPQDGIGMMQPVN